MVYDILVCKQTVDTILSILKFQFHFNAQLVVNQYIQKFKKKNHTIEIWISWNVKSFESFHLSWTSVREREESFYFSWISVHVRERKNFHSSSEKYEEIVFISHESVHVRDYEEVRKRQFISNELVHVRERKGEFSFLMNECMWIWKRKFSRMNLCARKRERGERSERKFLISHRSVY